MEVHIKHNANGHQWLRCKRTGKFREMNMVTFSSCFSGLSSTFQQLQVEGHPQCSRNKKSKHVHNCIVSAEWQLLAVNHCYKLLGSDSLLCHQEVQWGNLKKCNLSSLQADAKIIKDITAGHRTMYATDHHQSELKLIKEQLMIK